MTKNQHLENLSEIRNIMERSSKFISLSGLSGVSAGIIALLGAGYAYNILNNTSKNTGKLLLTMTEESKHELFWIALVILILAISFGGLFTWLKTKKTQEMVWNNTSKKLLINMLIPLIVGGIFCLLLMNHGALVWVAPATLVFYGLACINASHHTLSDIRYLGISQLVLGLLNSYFLGYGLLFWALGFGILHIIYGGLMYYKYDRN